MYRNVSTGQSMADIGLLGLDTSHAEAFATVLAVHEHATVSAIWDGGDVRDESYRREFASRYDADLCAEPSDVIDRVDGAMVLTVNWDDHRRLATQFLESGIPTMVDKPIAGQLADLDGIAESAAETPFFGGSAVPFHPALDELDGVVPGQALYCAGYNDPFYYGVHLVDTVRSLVAADWHSVRPADDPGLTVDVRFEDETFATLRLDGCEEEKAFMFLSVDPARTVSIGASAEDRARMYESYVDAFLETVRGDRDDGRRILDAAELLLAVTAALEEDRTITRESRSLHEVHVDGEAFLREYSPYY